jgi:hypothetical protein
MGAADALPYTVGSLEPPFEHETYDRCVAEVRATLGDEVFSVLRSAGQAMTVEQAIGFALSDDNPDA